MQLNLQLQYFMSMAVTHFGGGGSPKEKASINIRVGGVSKRLTDACRSSDFPIRSSSLSPLCSTLLMLSVRMTLTSFTWLCMWST